MLVSVSLGCCLDGLVGAILFRAAMIAVMTSSNRAVQCYDMKVTCGKFA